MKKARKKRRPHEFTTEDLAKRWGMHPVSIRRWRSKGVGPSYKILMRNHKRKAIYQIEDIIAYEDEYL